LLYSTDADQIERSAGELNNLFEQLKGKAEYDAIVCYSGGKDSTYTLKLAVEKYRMKVLAFTLDNGFISPVALENIQRVVNLLGIDHITYKPSLPFMKELFRVSSLEPLYNISSLTRVSANCNSCISIVNITALKLALEKDVPFIFAGFTLGQIPANSIFYRNNYIFFEESRKPIIDKLKSKIGEDVSRYLEISKSLLNKTQIVPYNVNLLCLENITENEILERIKPLGWIKPGDVDGCSTNCTINSFNNYVHLRRFGYSPYELELSHLIRKKLLSREEALEKLQDQPKAQIDTAMSVLEMVPEDIVAFA
jgi:PP-loop superfamily ATP-utilizing enzyme